MMVTIKAVLRYMSGLLSVLIRGGSRVGHRRIVSRFGSDVQVLNAFRRIDLQAKLAPLSVLGSIGGMISDHVLVLELHSNFRADVLQLIHGIREERASSGEIR